MDVNGIEVFRSIIPADKLINDNSGQHYKTLMGKTKWLTNLTINNIEGDRLIEGFEVPSIQEVHEIIDPNSFCLVLEHWKCQRRFDLANYESTFKPIIDVFSSRGYWTDDAWEFLRPVLFSGGDHKAWQDAIRGEDDGLPEDIRKDWWTYHEANPRQDSFIRIIAIPRIKISVKI